MLRITHLPRMSLIVFICVLFARTKITPPKVLNSLPKRSLRTECTQVGPRLLPASLHGFFVPFCARALLLLVSQIRGLITAYAIYVRPYMETRRAHTMLGAGSKRMPA
jgi:hypothetical protein